MDADGNSIPDQLDILVRDYLKEIPKSPYAHAPVTYVAFSQSEVYLRNSSIRPMEGPLLFVTGTANKAWTSGRSGMYRGVQGDYYPVIP